MSQRKAASSFINDSSPEANLIQFSPHRNPCQVDHSAIRMANSNQNSRNNFIGDSILAKDRPRGLAVTTTGEKHSLDLDDSLVSLQPFAKNSTPLSLPLMETISEKSASQLSLVTKASKNSSNIPFKMAKSIKAFSTRKYRPVSTPRNIEILTHPKLRDKLSPNRNSATQTDSCSTLERVALKPPEYRKYISPLYDYNMHLEGPVGMKPNIYSFSTSLTPLKPPKVYTKRSHKWAKYFELRNIISALTFVTVTIWLILTFFDIEHLWDCYDILWDYVRQWFAEKEKPKTKVQLFATFLRDLWSS